MIFASLFFALYIYTSMFNDLAVISLNKYAKIPIMIKKILFILTVIPGIAIAGKFNYDGLSIGMSLNQARLSGYDQCDNDTSLGQNWISCTANKNFFPPFQGYNIDDAETQFPDGKTLSAINLITSTDVIPLVLAKKMNGSLITKNLLTIISIKNHEDSLIIMKGKIAIVSSNL
mgnify:CR=1 FL=1